MTYMEYCEQTSMRQTARWVVLTPGMQSATYFADDQEEAAGEYAMYLRRNFSIMAWVESVQ